MSRRRPIFLKRAVTNEERRHSQARSEERAASSAFRWAGVGAAFIVAIGVMVGFTGYGQALARNLSGLEWLTAPLVFGISAADLLAILIVALAAAWIVWRDWRRARK